MLIGPLAVVLFVLASPTYVGYLFLNDEAAFVRDGAGWWIVLALAPLLATALVYATGRRPTTFRRCARRAPVLLAATALTSAAALLLDRHLHGPPDPLHFSVAPAVGSAAALLALLGYWRRRDRERAPRQGKVEPVTVEQVRRVTAQGRQNLRQVRIENDRLERLARKIDAKLAEARWEMEFEGLRHLHGESRGCADTAYRHYQSAGERLTMMSRTHAGVKVALRRPVIPIRGRIRPDRTAYATATAELTATQSALALEVGRGRTMVTTLNQRTATLKYRIRDECGVPGQLWYTDLEMRIEAARAARGEVL